jgi:hypothetical protein
MAFSRNHVRQRVRILRFTLDGDDAVTLLRSVVPVGDRTSTGSGTYGVTVRRCGVPAVDQM